MRSHSGFSVGLFIFVLGCALFFLAALPYPVAEPWPWRGRLIAAGLFCWSVSTALP
jgi:hypothetical protein